MSKQTFQFVLGSKSTFYRGPFRGIDIQSNVSIMSVVTKWRSLLCDFNQLQLKATLLGGQSFRWKNHKQNDTDQIENEFIGVFANIVWILRQTERELQYRIVGEQSYPNGANKDVTKSSSVHEPSTTVSNLAQVRLKVVEPVEYGTGEGLLYPVSYYEQLLRVYFRLDVDLEQHYQQWIKCHEHFANSATKFYAVRQLDQDPVENLFCFICSQNNHISRISDMVEKLCRNYGEKICEYEGTCYYNFPSVSALADATVEEKLRELGFGYRAKYIQRSADKILHLGDLDWFRQLCQLDYKAAHKELLSLPGIGPKVADCICLMSLGHLQAIPVDTHVFQLAKHYLPTLAKSQNVTDRQYVTVADKFREIYGEYAGWAQTVLFCSDLRQFRQRTDAEGQENSDKPRKKQKKKI
ncbi:N-glycosylase/DNA lyase [Anopheles marshallii]|uniref:N-glycosylase/DNA lyase n=1 Tax=Anopheles marshallii TaxID=1521116 RepID=UPI00237A5194|nr:N-glycosylase/DNA lyase [Anopheles marshallii]